VLRAWGADATLKNVNGEVPIALAQKHLSVVKAIEAFEKLPDAEVL
jgi:hypothetical protein